MPKTQKRRDHLSKADRSALMSRIRGKGNRSTEARVVGVLVRNAVRGWLRHPKDIAGRPDVYFPAERVAVFVDGCFWHGCPKCGRSEPKSNRAFWKAKIERNRRRDRRNKRTLRKQGVAVVRIWEHELKARQWWLRLRRKLGEKGYPFTR